MSNPNPFGGGDFFQGLLGDLLKLVKTEGPINWDLTRQIAMAVAGEGQTGSNIDPLDRIKLEELVHLADLQVSSATGLSTSIGGKPVSAKPVNRTEWAWHTLEAWRPLIETMAKSLAPDPSEPQASTTSIVEGADNFDALLGQWATAMGPALLGLQFGSMVGHLAQRALGQYDLPIPRPETDQLLLVPESHARFADDWSLPIDDLRLWVCLSEVAHHCVIGRPHVTARLQALLGAYADGFQPDSSNLEERFADLDPSDPEALQRALGDPGAVLGEMITDAQRRVQAELVALVSAIEGWVDYVADKVGQGLIGSLGALSEAMRRHRVELGSGDRFVERMFGLELGQDQFDRGTAFVKGVLERAGEEGLAQLWLSEKTLPTPAEVDAPGLWLERIKLPEEDQSTGENEA